MALLDRATVLAYLDDRSEIPAALEWATHHRLQHAWDADRLVFSLRLFGQSENTSSDEPYLLRAQFDDYRLLPPTWRFLDPQTGHAIGPAAYPVGNWPGGSVLHSNGLICAPWSRDAYGDRGGPHPDWGEATMWQSVAPQHTQANTIPDMLARIHAEVRRSPGRMAPLPQRDQEAA
jgi:hypothetical protein